MHFLIKAKTVGGDVTQNVAQFLVQSEDLASRYQQQIFHHVLFWVVLQFFKCSLPEEKKLSYTTINTYLLFLYWTLKLRTISCSHQDCMPRL